MSLTPKQKAVLDAIRDYQLETSLSPTLAELGEILGVNKVTVFGHVQALIKKGFLENIEPGASRGLHLVQQQSDFSSPDLEPTDPSIPLLGRIAAGGPIEAIEHSERVTIQDLLPQESDLYLLEVKGDSMIDAHIASGDLVMVRRDRSPNPGDIVVGILPNEEATLKFFHPQADGTILLKPANPDYEPISCTQLEVRGVVDGVIRHYR